MLRLITVHLCLLANVELAAKDFAVERFSFRWPVIELQDESASLDIVKSEQLTTVRVSSRSDSLILEPAAAIELGEALRAADRIFAAHLNEQKTVTNGDSRLLTINFLTTSAGIQQIVVMKKSEPTHRIALNREVAGKFAKSLLEAKQMCDFVDRKVMSRSSPAAK